MGLKRTSATVFHAADSDVESAAETDVRSERTCSYQPVIIRHIPRDSRLYDKQDVMQLRLYL